ncbi:hypothetical protein QKU48_gp0241 [Fadolivirus algeromassiliense]|jgi:m7GpppX diphosphatase|uniref:Scavenger mRNA decapping enzyme n=1 Tax=Fadolivirus FV1/VV64 TaxID=3070911 RepID=A0A7D3QVN0_9VIRU|nr:hypothetical protein QKU48_gp0241 [Fadolivirus algeromassiliense]QKF93699.1 hypothetical protein Fadolivirus_1_241 [Fadolivirus FV1/VV64]
MDFSKIKDLKLITSSEHQNSQTFLGKYNNNDIIIKIKGITDYDFDFNKATNLNQIMNNDRFYKYICNNISQYEIIIVYPVLEEDYHKYLCKRKRIIETPEMYYTKIYPQIINQDLAWIDNIINGVKETETIVYSDENIVMIPDLKWSSKNIDDMYYLVIFKNKNLRSIRDLNQSYLPLLKKTKEICINKINELHSINSNQLRLYFHYHPSFWQLHLHINLITNPWHGASIDFAHLLTSVCMNIELVNDYYQKANIEINEIM